MAIVPSGLPAWTRTADTTTYGGDLNKQNYLTEGVIDPTTDISAAQFVRMTEDLASVVRTAPFLIIKYLNNDATTSAPTVSFASGQFGTALTGYDGASPPGNMPSLARNVTGNVTITFASSFADAYGVSAAFAPTASTATANGPSDKVLATADPSGQTVLVRMVDDTGNAAADQIVTVAVW